MMKIAKPARTKRNSDDTGDSHAEISETEIAGVKSSKAKKAKTDAGSKILYTMMVTGDELPSNSNPTYRPWVPLSFFLRGTKVKGDIDYSPLMLLCLPRCSAIDTTRLLQCQIQF